MESITIRNIRVLTANFTGKNLVIVKVETSEPELWGWGCATNAYRGSAVAKVIEQYLKPLLTGRDADNVEELWQLMNANGYWRNGPVLNNALSGIDMALWDIKGKRAKMPLCSLLGGRTRKGVPVYRHGDGNSMEEIEENIHRLREEKIRHIRLQWGVYGGRPGDINSPRGSEAGVYFCPNQYINDTLRLFEAVRNKIGFGVELIHDCHERLTPIEGVRFAKLLEPYRLFYLEDVLPPEQGGWLRMLRTQTSTPIAMGELFNNPKEWDYLITEGLVDFLRVHISQIGGITPARKLAAFAEQFGIRTAWHGPSDVSPIGHGANVHLGLTAYNTGIQEWTDLMDSGILREAFPGMPEVKEGYLYVNQSPGLGIDVNEDLLERYPARDEVVQWTQARIADGTVWMP